MFCEVKLRKGEKENEKLNSTNPTALQYKKYEYESGGQKLQLD